MFRIDIVGNFNLFDFNSNVIYFVTPTTKTSSGHRIYKILQTLIVVEIKKKKSSDVSWRRDGQKKGRRLFSPTLSSGSQ